MLKHILEHVDAMNERVSGAASGYQIVWRICHRGYI